jgi:ribonuclease BN (tRNA processing enzyme)
VDGKSKIVLLGTGTPNADPERSGPSVAIVVDHQPYLFDFGPGVVRRAAAACMAGVEELKISNLNRAFVTHLHSDHTAGLPDLLLTPWVLERKEPLEIYGPKGICEMTENILAAYRLDIQERLEGLEPANDSGYKVKCKEIEPGFVYQDKLIKVEAFSVKHGSWDAFGYRICTPDRTIVLSGDTAPFEGYQEAFCNCDVLIHEVYSAEGYKHRSRQWQKYHASVHTSSHELAQIASYVKPGLLVLYHQLFFGVSEQELVDEVRAGYDGEIVSGNDLEVY